MVRSDLRPGGGQAIHWAGKYALLTVLLLALSLCPKFSVSAVEVHYTVGGGIDYTGTEPVDTHTYNIGDTITLAEPGDLSCSGYSFAGWSKVININSTSDILPSGHVYKVEAADAGNLVFYSIFKRPMPKLTIDYEGATSRPMRDTYFVDPDDLTKLVTMVNGEVSSDIYLPLPASVGRVSADQFSLAKTGYTYMGLYTGADGSGDAIVVDGPAFNSEVLASITGDMTIYAHFVAEEEEPEVTPDASGGVEPEVTPDASGGAEPPVVEEVKAVSSEQVAQADETVSLPVIEDGYKAEPMVIAMAEDVAVVVDEVETASEVKPEADEDYSESKRSIVKVKEPEVEVRPYLPKMEVTGEERDEGSGVAGARRELSIGLWVWLILLIILLVVCVVVIIRYCVERRRARRDTDGEA